VSGETQKVAHFDKLSDLYEVESSRKFKRTVSDMSTSTKLSELEYLQKQFKEIAKNNLKFKSTYTNYVSIKPSNPNPSVVVKNAAFYQRAAFFD